MTLVLVLEQRFDRTSDGRVWAPGPFLSAVWPRYLQVFSRLRVVARVRNVPTAARDWERADGEAVSFAAVPHHRTRHYKNWMRRKRSCTGRAISLEKP